MDDRWIFVMFILMIVMSILGMIFTPSVAVGVIPIIL